MCGESAADQELLEGLRLLPGDPVFSQRSQWERDDLKVCASMVHWHLGRQLVGYSHQHLLLAQEFQGHYCVSRTDAENKPSGSDV